jgi:hypothetical protein
MAAQRVHMGNHRIRHGNHVTAVPNNFLSCIQSYELETALQIITAGLLGPREIAPLVLG